MFEIKQPYSGMVGMQFSAKNLAVVLLNDESTKISNYSSGVWSASILLLIDSATRSEAEKVLRQSHGGGAFFNSGDSGAAQRTDINGCECTTPRSLKLETNDKHENPGNCVGLLKKWD
jgi:hypothetical protein